MGRPRGFNRDEVLEKSIQVFWKKGYADTSVQDLERTTGVNKSGLYSEFDGKDDLFSSCLEYYAKNNGAAEILEKKPLGWNNIESFLKKGVTCSGQRGCFMTNSVREAPILPAKAKSFMLQHMSRFRELVKKNVEAGGASCPDELATDLILTFNSGLSLEQNLIRDEKIEKRIEAFLKILKKPSR